MRNFKLVIQYDGSRYKGFQRQKDNDLTIQGKIEDVLSKMAEAPISLIGCERTDVGVHAENYVANFHSECLLSCDKIVQYLYAFLPEDIVVKSIEEVNERFHARYNVKSKTYVYTINNHAFRNVFDRKYTYHTDDPLDLVEMKKVAKMLEGEHDFQSFTSLKSDSKSTVRTIESIHIVENKERVQIEVTANDFLWHMPRLVISALIAVGRGNLTTKDVQTLLDEKKKPDRAIPAKTKGLCFKEATY